jgi:hypothetical protein
MPADNQDRRVDGDRDTHQTRQRKSSPRGEQDWRGDQHRRDFQPPGEAIVGLDRAPGEQQCD